MNKGSKSSTSSLLGGLLILVLGFGVVYLFARVRKHDQELKRLRGTFLEDLRAEQIEAIVRHVMSNPHLSLQSQESRVPIHTSPKPPPASVPQPVKKEKSPFGGAPFPFGEILQSVAAVGSGGSLGIGVPFPMFGSVHVPPPRTVNRDFSIIEEEDEEQEEKLKHVFDLTGVDDEGEDEDEDEQEDKEPVPAIKELRPLSSDKEEDRK